MEGSDDERKIRKPEKAAEKEAERKIVARKKSNKGARRFFPYHRDHPTGVGVLGAAWPEMCVPHPVYGGGGGRGGRPAGPCHTCAEFGHLKYSCPKMKSQSNQYLSKSVSSTGDCELFDACDLNSSVNDSAQVHDTM